MGRIDRRILQPFLRSMCRRDWQYLCNSRCKRLAIIRKGIFLSIYESRPHSYPFSNRRSFIGFDYRDFRVDCWIVWSDYWSFDDEQGNQSPLFVLV